MKTNKEILADNLFLIEIETFSFCNRKCWFCTNTIVDRKMVEHYMPEEVYSSLIGQLAEINFAGELTFSRYNEPLSRKDVILARVREAREWLPKAILRINTNGDYLNAEYIEELADAGLSQLWVQQYLQNEERYDHDRVKSVAKRTLKRLGYSETHKVLTDIEGCKVEYELPHPKMTVHLRARNFGIDGSSRGGMLELANGYQRVAPCKQVHQNMYIDWNGVVMVCCEMRSELKEHSGGVMGSVHKDKLWDIFCSEKYKSWREHHADVSPKEGVCKECRQGLTPDYEK